MNLSLTEHVSFLILPRDDTEGRRVYSDRVEEAGFPGYADLIRAGLPDLDPAMAANGCTHHVKSESLKEAVHAIRERILDLTNGYVLLTGHGYSRYAGDHVVRMKFQHNQMDQSEYGTLRATVRYRVRERANQVLGPFGTRFSRFLRDHQQPNGPFFGGCELHENLTDGLTLLCPHFLMPGLIAYLDFLLQQRANLREVLATV